MNYSALRFLHRELVHERRVTVLSRLLANIVPENAEVLDVGCGDGLIGHLIERAKPSVHVRGLEVRPRTSSQIECLPFDGKAFPLQDRSVDVCLFVDVLHHTLNITELLREARRVTRRYVLVKDHVCAGPLDQAALRFMDWIGNRPHGVDLPYNYQSRDAWEKTFQVCALHVLAWNQDIRLYPMPFNWLFSRGMHCLVLLERL